jgi:hypothetical protein
LSLNVNATGDFIKNKYIHAYYVLLIVVIIALKFNLFNFNAEHVKKFMMPPTKIIDANTVLVALIVQTFYL